MATSHFREAYPLMAEESSMIDRSGHHGEGGWRSLFVRVLEKLAPDTLLEFPDAPSARCSCGRSAHTAPPHQHRLAEYDRPGHLR